jgi:hypothetical protein
MDLRFHSRQNQGKKIIDAPDTRIKPIKIGDTPGRKRIHIAEDEAMSEPSKTTPMAYGKGDCFMNTFLWEDHLFLI